MHIASVGARSRRRRGSLLPGSASDPLSFRLRSCALDQLEGRRDGGSRAVAWPSEAADGPTAGVYFLPMPRHVPELDQLLAAEDAGPAGAALAAAGHLQRTLEAEFIRLWLADTAGQSLLSVPERHRLPMAGTSAGMLGARRSHGSIGRPGSP